MDTRRCRKCDQDKPIKDFKKHSRNPSGFDTICKKCHRQFDSDWQATAKGKSLMIWRSINHRKNKGEVVVSINKKEWTDWSIPLLDEYKKQHGEWPELIRDEGQPFEIKSLKFVSPDEARQIHSENMTERLIAHPNKYKSGKYGYFIAKKGRINKSTKKTLRWRSSYELAAFLKLENDPNVFCYYVESERFKYRKPTNNFDSTYIVDLFVLDLQGRITLIEIKPLCKLQDPIVIMKIKAVLATKKWRFRVWTEKNIFPAICKKETMKMAAAFSRKIKKGSTYKWDSDLYTDTVNVNTRP